MYLNTDIISSKVNKIQGNVTEELIYERLASRLGNVGPGAMGVELDRTSHSCSILLVWGQSSFSAWGNQALNISLTAKSKIWDKSEGFLCPQADALNWCFPIADAEH